MAQPKRASMPQSFHCSSNLIRDKLCHRLIHHMRNKKTKIRAGGGVAADKYNHKRVHTHAKTTTPRKSGTALQQKPLFSEPNNCVSGTLYCTLVLYTRTRLGPTCLFGTPNFTMVRRVENSWIRASHVALQRFQRK